ncbi:hypothetical protein LQ567_23615 [Niabella pedocola]|uniref:Uncharacterized protein n=1 Tax=Niabella pedocola TaxID=1752077 RepID=A0ABS8PZT4_9BACT|nr:hypothetical protein [Niabella pedocola]MCD2425792.1 hypothetical protein [Niabella pedocola]
MQKTGKVAYCPGNGLFFPVMSPAGDVREMSIVFPGPFRRPGNEGDDNSIIAENGQSGLLPGKQAVLSRDVSRRGCPGNEYCIPRSLSGDPGMKEKKTGKAVYCRETGITFP